MDEEFHERKDRVARDPGQSFQEPGPVMIVFTLKFCHSSSSLEGGARERWLLVAQRPWKARLELD